MSFLSYAFACYLEGMHVGSHKLGLFFELGIYYDSELCVLFPGYLCILQLMFIVKFFMHAKIWSVTLVMRSIRGDYD